MYLLTVSDQSSNVHRLGLELSLRRLFDGAEAMAFFASAPAPPSRADKNLEAKLARVPVAEGTLIRFAPVGRAAIDGGAPPPPLICCNMVGIFLAPTDGAV